MQILSESLETDQRFCLSNKCLGNAETAGPRTILGVVVLKLTCTLESHGKLFKKIGHLDPTPDQMNQNLWGVATSKNPLCDSNTQ